MGAIKVAFGNETVHGSPVAPLNDHGYPFVCVPEDIFH